MDIDKLHLLAFCMKHSFIPDTKLAVLSFINYVSGILHCFLVFLFYIYIYIFYEEISQFMTHLET